MTSKVKKTMSSLYSGDSWDIFLAQRERAPSWKIPLNIAVALHLLVFAGAVFMPDVGKKPEVDKIIMIDLLSLPPAGPGLMAAQQVVQPQGKKKAVPSQKIEPVQTKVVPQPLPEIIDSEPEPVEEVIVPPVIVTEVAPKPKVRPGSVAGIKPISLRPLKRKKKLVEDVRLAEVKEREQRKKQQEQKQKQERLTALEKKRLAEQRKREQAVEKERKLVARKKKQKKVAAQKAQKKQAKKQAEQQRRRQDVTEAARLARQAEQAAEQARLEAARARNEYASVSQAVTDLGTPLASGGTGFSSGGGGDGRGGYGGSGSTQINPAVLNQYTALLNGRISNHWRIPEILKKKFHLKAVVALTVRRDGSIKDMRIERKSGDSVFDQSVLKALQSSAPLPGFPALIDKPILEFALNFTPDGLAL